MSLGTAAAPVSSISAVLPGAVAVSADEAELLDISKAEVTLSQTEYTYDGTEKKPGKATCEVVLRDNYKDNGEKHIKTYVKKVACK